MSHTIQSLPYSRDIADLAFEGVKNQQKREIPSRVKSFRIEDFGIDRV